MKSLREHLIEADRNKYAISHFNISELSAFNAITSVARELSLPVIIGVSDGERNFIGVKQVAALVQSVRDEFNQPVFLNSDHTHALEDVEAAAHAGFDLIVFDASSEEFSVNVAKTKEAVPRAKAIRPNILVEGELGFIGASSSIHESRPTNLSP